TAWLLVPAVLATAMPRAAAAQMSILSTPTDGCWINRQRRIALMISPVSGRSPDGSARTTSASRTRSTVAAPALDSTTRTSCGAAILVTVAASNRHNEATSGVLPPSVIGSARLRGYGLGLDPCPGPAQMEPAPYRRPAR